MVTVVYDPILGASVVVVTLPPVALLPVEVRGREGLDLQDRRSLCGVCKTPQWTAGCWIPATT